MVNYSIKRGWGLGELIFHYIIVSTHDFYAQDNDFYGLNINFVCAGHGRYLLEGSGAKESQD